MGKILILLAFFSTIALAKDKTENNIYGDFRLSYAKVNTKTGSVASTNGLQVVNNASRLGFKGSRKNSNWEAFYHFQLGAVNDDDTVRAGVTSRFFFAGLKSKYGTVTGGRLSTPYKMAGVKLDNFYDTSAGSGAGGANFGLSGTTNGFTNDSFVYKSPKFFNVVLTAAAFIDDADTDRHDYNLGLTYTNGGFSGGVQHLAINGTGVIANSMATNNIIRIHAKYTADKWNLGASYEDLDTNGTNTKYTYLNAAYFCGKGSKIAASYGTVKDTGIKANDGTGYSIGYFHELLPKTTIHALLSRVDNDDNLTKRDTVAVGLSHKFGWSIL